MGANDVFTDLNSLQSIRQLDKQDRSAAMMEVAQQFESMFLNMMLTSMRQANDVFSEDSLFNSPESSFYEGMLDNQMALTLAGQGESGGRGIGLADVIHRQLMSQYGKEDMAADPAARIDQSKLFDRRVASLPMRQALVEVDEVLAKQALAAAATPAASVEALSGVPTSALTAVMSAASPGQAAAVPSALKAENLRQQGVTQAGGKGAQFESPEDFVSALYPHARVIGAELGVDPRAIVAQAALETGWGKHMIQDASGNNSFNFFGIKADQRWSGNAVTVTTHEVRNGVMLKEKAAFRSYDSLEQGLRDYASFLQSSRYQNAVGQGLDGDRWGYELQKAGYATDPAYGDKIRRIARGELLNQVLAGGESSSEPSSSVTSGPSGDKD